MERDAEFRGSPWDEPKKPNPWFGYMQCSPCGFVTTDKRARTCCKGCCLDPTGESCNAWPCPSCGKLHAWTGSISEQHAHTDANRGLRAVLGEALRKSTALCSKLTRPK